MTRVIVVASGKGGVGKTTLSANLGVALALHGEEVVVLDLDLVMANLELVLGLEGKPVTLQDVLSGNDVIHNAIYEGPGGVRIVPAGLSIHGLKDMRLERLEEVLEVLVEGMDLLLIDAPGGLEKDALAALKIAEELILVTTPEITSISDALKTKIVAEKLGIDVLGVVVNMGRTHNAFLTPDEIEAILDCSILTTIPEDIELKKAYAAGRSILINKPNSKTSKIIMGLAASIIGRYDYENDLSSQGIVSKFVSTVFGKYIDVYKSK